MKNGEMDEQLREKFFKIWRKFKGGIHAEKHKALAAEIREDIDQIRNLTKGAMDLEDSRIERSSSEIFAYWKGIRDHFLHIYDAFRVIWSKACQLHDHQVSLPLIFSDTKLPEAMRDYFHVSLLHLDSRSSIHVSYERWDATIYLTEAPITL